MANRLHKYRTFFIASFVFILSLCWNLALANPARSFLENKGQVTDQFGDSRSDINFKVKTGNGLNIFLANGAIHYQWTREGGGTIDMYRMDVRLLGANPNARVSYDDKLSYYERYYLPSVGAEGAIARTYRKITYHEVYPHIDWVFYFNAEGKLEHDFIVRPGGNPADIRLEYAGAGKLAVNADGSLTATTPMGMVTEAAPYTYVRHSETRGTGKEATSPVRSSFALDGNILSFLVADYTGTLVIDPTLEWGTYFGGTVSDDIRKLVTDDNNDLYAIGTTNSTSNIATTGSHQTSFGGGVDFSAGADAFLVKFHADGTCAWATYYGGNGVDWAIDLAIDTAGFVYMAGRTNSPNGIATTGSYQEQNAGLQDAFIVKFDTSGARIWGTYFGGENGEGMNGVRGIAIAADNFGNLYLAGNTFSTTGIATAGAFQSLRNDGDDGFLAKFTTDGELEWGTYYGGNGNDYIKSIIADDDGNIYMGGNTLSTTGLSTSGSYQEANNGDYDAFLAKFDSQGQRVWGTYFGGEWGEELWDLAIDGNGDLLVTGSTQSEDNIASTGSYQEMLAGAVDIFLSKFNPAGQLQWSTYFGGNGNDTYPRLHIGLGDLIYLSGTTDSDDGIATSDAINTDFNGEAQDIFFGYFEPSGERIWASYFGGLGTDQCFAFAGDASDNIYMAGRTNSAQNISTPGAHQEELAGSYDAFIVKVNACDKPAAPGGITGAELVCEGSEQLYSVAVAEGSDSYSWIIPSGWAGESETESITVIPGAQSGAIAVAALNICGSSDTVSVDITVDPAPEPQVQRTADLLTVTSVFATYQWNKDGDPIEGATEATYLVIQNGSYSVTVSVDNGCEGTSEEMLIDDITGISDLIAGFNIRVYPNPVTDHLIIDLPFKATATVSGITGTQLISKELPKGKSGIDLSDLPAGIYLLQLYSGPEVRLGNVKLTKTGN